MARMLILLLASFTVSTALPEPLARFIRQAQADHGAAGARAAEFLVAHMPEADRRRLTSEFLGENLNLAFQARASFPWASEVPEAVFLNDVLPYAVLDEARDPWRADFMKKASPIVKGAKSASEAAQRLNREFFKSIKTHYDTGRKRTNQSPLESIAQGKATCTGLSIILVDACRAVGIPARAVGIPMWPDGSGNHTWVEIYDRGQWHYTGADEYNAKGLNHAWFSAAAAKADGSKPRHSIYATSWQARGSHFPMVWSPASKQVGAVEVTTRYASAECAECAKCAEPTANQLGIRLFANEDRGSRIACKGWLAGESKQRLRDFTTKAGTSDLNDMPQVPVTPGETYRLVFQFDDKTLRTEPFQPAAGSSIRDVRVAELKPVPAANLPERRFSRANAPAMIQLNYRVLVEAQADARRKELEAKSITLGDHTLKWLEKTFGEAAEGERSLWISMHGGGSAPERVNTQQWHNQIKLYQPKEGIYVAPRAPTNTWNMWHQGHIDELFGRLIENMVAYRGVDPDKVYLMGYSAGGDGVWQVAPRMADRFAAASMMAGHPNEAKLLGLRNLPFGIFCGENDTPHKRNEVCAQRMEEIAEMAKADPGGYPHMTRLYKGMGHWMKLKDAESLPWMAGFSRRTWPKKLVWYQDDVTHDRFYWLQLPAGAAAKGQRIDGQIVGQHITLKGDVPSGTRLLLHDALLDLDQEIRLTVNDGQPTTHRVGRSMRVIRTALEKRLDPKATPTAEIALP